MQTPQVFLLWKVSNQAYKTSFSNSQGWGACGWSNKFAREKQGKKKQVGRNPP